MATANILEGSHAVGKTKYYMKLLFVRFLALIVLMCFYLSACPQDKESAGKDKSWAIKIYPGTGMNAKIDKFDLDINNLGLLWEVSVGGEIRLLKELSIFSKFGLPQELYVDEVMVRLGSEPENKLMKQTIPTFTNEIRYYYNANKRKEKGKNIKGFSSNYIGLSNTVSFILQYSSEKGIHRSPVYYSGIHTGIQRNLFHKLFFDANLGYGLNFGNNNTYFTPAIFVGVGYRI